MNETPLDPMLAGWLREGPDRGPREGLERALAATHRTNQRPRWTFVQAWLPMRPSTARVHVPRVFRTALLMVLLALALALVAAIVGSRPRLPAPIGPAANGLVAFETDQGIFVAEVDGSGRRKVSGDDGRAWSPEFSSDGTQLAFVSGPPADYFSGSLLVVPTDGSHPPIKVSGDIQLDRAYYPALAWSPDARQIAFAGMDQGVTAIYVAATDGSGLRAITDRTAAHDLPSWSPDGTLVAYRITPFDRSRRSLAVARPDGSDERILTSVTGSESTLSIARWSPDGRRLAYYRTESGTSRAMLVDLNGGDVSIWPDEAGGYADTGIAWSPDGESLAIFTGDGLVVTDVDGGNPRPLHDRAYCWIEWSPDGTALYGPSGDFCGGVVNVVPVAHPDATTTTMEGVLSWQRVPP